MNKFIFLFFIFVASTSWAGVIIDALDDKINLGDHADFSPHAGASGQMTVFAWVKNNADTGDRQWIVTKGTGSNYEFAIYLGSSETFSCNIWNLGGDDRMNASGTTVFSIGDWHAVACTYNRETPRMDVFVDGVSEANDTTSAGDSADGTSDLLIGARGDSANFFLNGTVSEVAMWDVALTDAEILSLSTSRVKRMPLQVRPASLVFYLPLDDISDGVSADGATFRDLSQNGHDGTGDNGGNDTGLTATAEAVSSY